MLRELLLSVASGIIVAVVLQIFRRRDRRDEPVRQMAGNVRYAPPRRRQGSIFGGLVRFVLAIAGGIALAYAAAPFILPRRFRDWGDYDGYDRYDGFRGLQDITSNAPMLMLTVFGTIVCWMVLSAMMRR